MGRVRVLRQPQPFLLAFALTGAEADENETLLDLLDLLAALERTLREAAAAAVSTHEYT
ncbi:hypothetical protein AB0958_31250 [Streptomyces sp. NPDC006655]|uniref:hypothetical protein n=1 Tax=Streptomyces sp. NPDC006655 TaxID=3156898 RepID=UPI003456AD2A